MNKIFIDLKDQTTPILINEDTELILNANHSEKELKIVLGPGAFLFILEMSTKSKNKITLELHENSYILYNKLGKDCEDQIEVLLQHKSSKVEIHHSYMSNNTSRCRYKIIHSAPYTTSVLHNHGINYSREEMRLDVDAIVDKKAKGATTSQENKIINTNCGKSRIYPNLVIDQEEVSASHSAYISEFDQDILFYMKLRGIDEVSAKKLLMKSFLLGNLKQVDSYQKELEKMI